MITKRLALLSALSLLLAHGLNAQTVNTLKTLAGGGKANGDGMTAVNAVLGSPQGLNLDATGNLYIADKANHHIRKVSVGTNLISTIAGTGSGIYAGVGGTAISTAIPNPEDVAVDGSGNVYITSGNRIFRIDQSTNVVSLIGGDGSRFGTSGFSDVGKGLFNAPTGIAVDAAGNVYVADKGNHRIRKITPSGVVSTVAGSGTAGLSGDGAAALSAKLNNPYDVALDTAGNLYITDQGNHRVRMVAAAARLLLQRSPLRPTVLWLSPIPAPERFAKAAL